MSAWRVDTEAVTVDVPLAATRNPGTGNAPPSWSEERVAMYGRSQRADWGAFVRRQGFDTT